MAQLVRLELAVGERKLFLAEWRDLGLAGSGYAMTPSAQLLPMFSGLDNHLEPRGTGALGHHRCLGLA